jgi:Raf kinase inhibitor-like YbhB/YbcL family protein
MILTSPSFNNGEMIPRKFTCDGGGINPELEIQNVPSEAKSLALIVHDPDAPREGGFMHWAVWNIDSATSLIKEESVPPRSIEGMNTLGELGWASPCPSSGVHHYHFRLYALDAALSLEEGATAEAVLDAMVSHIIEEADLTGLYEKA